MNWNKHCDLEGQHAFLSASNYHWLNYTPDKLVTVFKNEHSKKEGIELHEFASIAIKKRLRLSKTKGTLNQFVNDAIGFGMESEQMLFYSPNSFGTADAISFKDNVLRVHDFKSGYIRASFKQLDVYCALFCLEYRIDPTTITVVQRIYQNNEYEERIPTAEDIQFVMNKIISDDMIIEQLKAELA